VATAKEDRLSFADTTLGVVRVLARRDGAGVRLVTRRAHNLLLHDLCICLMIAGTQNTDRKILEVGVLSRRG
jgi:hypothetical protein